MRALIQDICKKELGILTDALRVVEYILAANRSKIRTTAGTGTSEAVSALFAKGWKTVQAIRVLAEAGYGQDAMILLRSLTNLTIDLAYISHADSEERVRQWVAFAQVCQRQLAREIDAALPEEAQVDWDDVQQRANKWNGPKIKGRADDAGLGHFYGTMYRFGSLFEHPDAWGVASYISDMPDGLLLKVEPSQQFTRSALGGSVLCLGVLIECLGRFFGFDFEGHVEQMRRLTEALSDG